MAPGEVPKLFCAMAGACAMAPERMAALANVVIDIRLPRVLAAMLVGASLSGSGAAFQAVFRNPLVSPGLLGVLAGASAGAALGIILGGSWRWCRPAPSLAGLAAVAIGVGIARAVRARSLVMLILGGILSGALFTSLLSMVKYVADPYNQLPAIVYWLMGSLGQVRALGGHGPWQPPMLAGIVVLCLLGRALDALAMGDDEARALGVPASAVRLAPSPPPR